MADNDGDHITSGTFSDLLFAGDDVGLDPDGCYNYTSSFSTENPPKMLCFGECTRRECDSSSASSNNKDTNKTLLNANKKRNGLGNESVQEPGVVGGPVGGQRSCKKTKSENSGRGKMRREKLGERISALQQLVSPYGKTDTASVLHEAMGYIRFLHEQVQMLCSPYMQRPSPSSSNLHEAEEKGGDEPRKDLGSRGLCLVPVDSTTHITSNNGADFWSPAAAKGNNTSSN